MNKKLLKLLQFAVHELQNHNESYHWKTPPEMVDAVRQAVRNPTKQNLDKAIEICKTRPGWL